MADNPTTSFSLGDQIAPNIDSTTKIPLISQGRTKLKAPVKINKPTKKIVTTPKTDTTKFPPVPGFYTYLHNDSHITTVDSLIKFTGWQDPDSGGHLTSKKILDVSDPNDPNKITNRQKIRATYNNSEINSNSPNFVKEGGEENLLKTGVRLTIPLACLGSALRAFLIAEGGLNTYNDDSSVVFIANELLRILENPSYKQTFNSALGIVNAEAIEKKFPQCEVWVWCKGLGDVDPGNSTPFASKGALFDISPFVSNLKTSTGENGGKFSFTLAPINCIHENGTWTFNKNSILNYLEPNRGGYSFVSENQIHNPKTQRRNNFLFHNILTSNDIVFIRFEKLSTDNPNDELNVASNGFRRELNELPGKVYDMMGLIDTNLLNHSSANATIGISVEGRDFMKLLIEDGSYFFTGTDVKTPTEGIFRNDNPEFWGRPMRQTETMGRISEGMGLFMFNEGSITRLETVMSVVISSMATAEICPDYVFEAYKNINFDGTANKDLNLDRRSSYLFYNEVKRTVQRFVGAGVWGVIKYICDTNVKDRYVQDVSIATYEGSLLNCIRKYVGNPWSEFWGDTYGDQYFLIARKPPFDYTGYKSLVDLIDKVRNPNTKESPLEISDSIVIADNLQFDDGEVYCWYRLRLESFQYGEKTENTHLSLQYPVVFFREYAEIWGNRSLDVSDPYIIDEGFVTSPADLKKVHDNQSKQAYNDLKFLVNSHAYLPFTRKGTITIKYDRRIKRGVCIRFLPTGEIFYVNAVTNDYSISTQSIDRTSTLQVSRGMVEKNPSGEDILKLYFSIIETGDKIESSSNKKQDEIIDSTEQVMNVYFDISQSNIIDPNLTTAPPLHPEDVLDVVLRVSLLTDTINAIEQLVNSLANNKNLVLKLTGHTCEYDYSPVIGGLKQMSLERAKNVAKIVTKGYLDLTQENLAPDRITVEAKGSENPLSHKPQKGDGEPFITNRQLNRNVRFSFMSKPSKKQTEPKTLDTYINWKVNQGIFNFFLRRKQFADKIDSLGQITSNSLLVGVTRSVPVSITESKTNDINSINNQSISPLT